MDAENINNDGCSQRDSAEHKGYARAHRSFNRIWKERDSAQPDPLEKGKATHFSILAWRIPWTV